MNINEELAPLPRWQPIGRRPTSESVLAFLRALAQYMLNITTKENTDGMGLAGCIMEDAKYQAKSANHAPYVEPPDPTLPTDLQLGGVTAEQRQIMQYNNKVAWENRDHRVKYKGKALNLLLAGGDARTYLAQFWDEDTGFSQRDLKNICDYLRDTYVVPDENDLKTVRDRLAAYKFSGGEVEPTIAFIELSATEFPTTHPFNDYQKTTTMYDKMVG